MKHKIIQTIQLIVIAVILPLFKRLELLGTWPILMVIAYGIGLNISQPKMSIKDKSPFDGFSLRLILVAAILVFLVPVVDVAYIRKALPTINSQWTWIGLILLWGGFAFRVWSIRLLGRFFTTQVELQQGHELIQSGPYKYLRHPSYTGSFVSAMGVSVFLHSMWGIGICFFVFFPSYIYRIVCEEKALTSIFQEKYTEYKKTTWKMFPYLF